jgi:hypothetical protein
MVMRVIDSTSESEVMTPMTRSDETVDIGPIKGAGGSRSHVQVRILPTMGRYIQTHSTDSKCPAGVPNVRSSGRGERLNVPAFTTIIECV